MSKKVCFCQITVHSTLDIITPKPKECVLTFRKLKLIDHSALKSDIEESLSKIGLWNSIDVQQLVGSYNTILSELLEKHAPLWTKKAKQSHRQPWFDDRIRREIVLRRKKERTYRNDPTEYNLMPSINSADLYPTLSKPPKEHIILKK